MKEELINNVLSHMQGVLDWRQMKVLKVTLQEQLSQVTITECDTPKGNDINILLDSFISAKKIEGCSDKSMH